MAGIDTGISGDFSHHAPAITGRPRDQNGISWLLECPLSPLSCGENASVRRAVSNGRGATWRTGTLALSLLAHVMALVLLLPGRTSPPDHPTEATYQLVFVSPPPVPRNTPPARAEPKPPPPPVPRPVPLPAAIIPPPAPAQDTRPPPKAPLTRPHAQKPPVRPAPPHAMAPPPTTPLAMAPPAQIAPVIPPRPVAGMQTNRAPPYPNIALQRGEQGRVMLRVSVSADGTPLAVDLAQTSGHPSLDKAALAAVRQWRFSPATQAGKPVPAVAMVPVQFRLDN